MKMFSLFCFCQLSQRKLNFFFDYVPSLKSFMTLALTGNRMMTAFPRAVAGFPGGPP